LFFGLLHSGRDYDSSYGYSPEIADTIIATIIYLQPPVLVIDRFLENRKRKREGN
jgi:hypothetical protein